ncbi:helicase [Mycobacterium sp. ACS1612]|nr:helicase [Mycobacterium sp. ACS1612]
MIAVAMMAILLALTAGGIYVGSAVVARHRAQAAADLAALAAAAQLADGAETACARATALTDAMGTTMTGCVVEDLDIVVTVAAAVPLGRFGVGPARATAKAGPADA